VRCGVFAEEGDHVWWIIVPVGHSYYPGAAGSSFGDLCKSLMKRLRSLTGRKLYLLMGTAPSVAYCVQFLCYTYTKAIMYQNVTAPKVTSGVD